VPLGLAGREQTTRHSPSVLGRLSRMPGTSAARHAWASRRDAAPRAAPAGLRKEDHRAELAVGLHRATEADDPALDTLGADVRRAEARALYEEGLTMEQIAEHFGVTRQRVSALLRRTNEAACVGPHGPKPARIQPLRRPAALRVSLVLVELETSLLPLAPNAIEPRVRAHQAGRERSSATRFSSTAFWAQLDAGRR
jgi:transcriptional regulator with XRE-family HTH domain